MSWFVAVPAGPAEAAGGRLVFLSGYGGNALDFTYAADDTTASFTMRTAEARSAELTVLSNDEESGAIITLVAPLGETITTGTRPVEWPFRAGAWALTVGQSCDATGSVTVHAVTITGDEVSRLVMDFTLLCDDGETDRPFRGWVVYDPGPDPGSLDGTVEKEGVGVANATVDVFEMDGASPVATATTDSNGDFLVGGLAPGA
ncbi:MAG: carboxypeptidase-like regulatory domain-containing protein [Acidimicrobiia bacterium]